MKLKTYTIQRIEKETKMELPVYFYFQGELMEEEYVRIDEKGKTSIKCNHHDTQIIFSPSETIISENYLSKISTEEDFEETLSFALTKIMNW
jgi:hypothetical protein